MIAPVLVVYGIIALGSLLAGAMIRSEERGKLTFWTRNVIVLSAFWPVTLILLAGVAVSDFRQDQERRRTLQLRETEKELREALDALDSEIDRDERGRRPRVLKGGKR